jgi:hypothetical protein
VVTVIYDQSPVTLYPIVTLQYNSTTLYHRMFPIVLSSCFSKVPIGFIVLSLQSPGGNHLGIEHGFPYLHPPRQSRDAGVNLTASAKVSSPVEINAIQAPLSIFH